MDARLARIGRLAAVAQGLEREGAYNGAKLLRAALESELVRYNNVEAPSGGADVAAALDALVIPEIVGRQFPTEQAVYHVAPAQRESATTPVSIECTSQ